LQRDDPHLIRIATRLYPFDHILRSRLARYDVDHEITSLEALSEIQQERARDPYSSGLNIAVLSQLKALGRDTEAKDFLAQLQLKQR
jgi:hypothetical protein